MNNSSVGSPRTSPAPLRGAAAVVGGGGSGSGKCFGPDGCPAVANGRRCGETRNLQIIQEFKRLYETKMKQIDDAAGGDCVQAKINLQQEWIRDLTDQNEMLVRVVEELEVEAAERVTMLEEKLQQSAKCACEVMGSYKDFSINFLADFQKMGYIQNDLNNLIEVVRRVKQYGVWNAKDLRFYTINVEDLTSDSALARRNLNGSDEEECRCQCNCKREGDANNRNCKHEKLAKEKDKKVNELQEKITRLRGTIEENEDAKKTYIQYQELKKSMLDMRDALTAEVAEKHDAVLSLRREVHMLEEQCRKADQQVHFKDDIIKELRKEIKQLKLQVQELEDYEKKHKDSLETVSTLKGELQKYKDEQRDSLTKVRTLSDENRAQADQIATLHEKLRQSLAKPPTTSTGVHAKMQSRDIGLDPAVPATRHVGITNAPETKNASTLSEIESMIVPAHHYHHKGAPKSFRSVAVETEDVRQFRSRRHPQHRYERTSSPESQEDSTEGAVVMTVGKRRAGVVEMVDALKPVTLDAYGCGPDVQCEIFDFVPNKLTATADKDNIEKYVNEDIVEALVEPVAARKKDNQGSARHSGEAEVLYDGKHAYRTSNESVGSEDAYTVMSEKPAKSVRIALEPKGGRKRRTAHLTESDSDENISGTVYYSVKEDSRAEEAPFMKKNAQDWYQGPNKVPKSRNAESGSRSTSPRSTSPQARRPAEELQTVVHDLNESVSRIIEKTPNEKATRERIAKLEAQLRAVNTHLNSIRSHENFTGDTAQSDVGLKRVPIDLQALAQKERDVDVERQKRNQEVENLKLTIREMEKALQNKEENSVNLQNAVDLYLNSINVLEQSEEHYKNEVAQQRITIANLQEALIATKQQLDELKEKCQKDVSSKWGSWFQSPS